MTNSMIISNIDHLIEEVTKLTIPQKLIRASKFVIRKKRVNSEGKEIGTRKFGTGKDQTSGLAAAIHYLKDTTMRGIDSNYKDLKFAADHKNAAIKSAVYAGGKTITDAGSAAIDTAKHITHLIRNRKKGFKQNIKDIAHDMGKKKFLRKAAALDMLVRKPTLGVVGDTGVLAHQYLHPWLPGNGILTNLAINTTRHFSNDLRSRRLQHAERERHVEQKGKQKQSPPSAGAST